MPKAAGLTLLSTLLLLLATTALGQEVLPQPEQPFKGKIGRTAKDSTPDFPKGVEAPEGAPNVLLILTDDVGFGASSTFGGRSAISRTDLPDWTSSPARCASCRTMMCCSRSP